MELGFLSVKSLDRSVGRNLNLTESLICGDAGGR